MCLPEELAQLHSRLHPLLPPPTLHSVKGTGLTLPMPGPLLGRPHGETLALGLAGMEWQEGRGPQHLVGEPHTHADPCPQVSPSLSLQPRPPQQPGSWLQPMAASTGLLCRGQPSSGIRVWVTVSGPRAPAPLWAQPVWLGRSWGSAPGAGGTGEQRCCETLGSAAAAPSPPLGMRGGHVVAFSCR